ARSGWKQPSNLIEWRVAHRSHIRGERRVEILKNKVPHGTRDGVNATLRILIEIAASHPVDAASSFHPRMRTNQPRIRANHVEPVDQRRPEIIHDPQVEVGPDEV